MMASRSSIRLGGMHHRGSRYYTLEITGCIYILMYLVLVMADIELLQPVLRNDVSQVTKDQRSLATLMNPNISDFNNFTQMQLVLQNQDTTKILTCDDIQGTLTTLYEDVPLFCSQGVNDVMFELPNKGYFE